MSSQLAVADIPASHLHSVVFVGLAFGFLAVTQIPLIAERRTLGFKRRCYWGGTAGAAICIILASIPDWTGGTIFATVAAGVMTMTAYFATPYIAIRGKVVAFHTYHERSSQDTATKSCTDQTGQELDPYPDQYGTGVTAKKAWWLLVPAMGLCVAMVLTNLGPGRSLFLLLSAAFFLVIGAFLLGFGDASWDYAVARRQIGQLVLITIITAGVFTVAYLAGFAWGRRRPYRAPSALERSLHPRFRDEK